MDEYSITDEATVSKISDQCPRAVSAYFLCLHRSDGEGRATLTRDQVMNECMRSWTKFKNDVRSLASLYVLNFVDYGSEIEIEFIREDLP